MITPNSFNSSTNNSELTVITPLSSNHSEVLAIDETGGEVRNIVLNPVGRAAGDRIIVNAEFPETVGILVNFRNASAGGEILEYFTTDGVQRTGCFQFAHTGGAFYLQQTSIPAFQP